MKIDDLKKKYDRDPIEQLEKEAGRNLSASVKQRKVFILMLYYLDRTSRFRENPRFKKATFEEYISDMFRLRPTTYNKERMAFVSHPSEAEKLGVGVVAKVRHKCGSLNAGKVLKEIQAIKNPSRDKIEAVIRENSREPKPKAPKKVTTAELEREIAAKDKIIADQNATIKEQYEQIQKLKAALIEAQDENSKITGVMAGVKAAMDDGAVGVV